MPTIIVSPNEREEVMTALGDSAFESSIPFDFLLYTSAGPVARERKQFPDDFLASVQDGRFSHECAAMREWSQYPGVIVEGRGNWTHDGHLKINGKPSGWTRKSIDGVFRSLRYVEGCDVEYTDSIEDTVALLFELQTYFDKSKHNGLRVRPTVVTQWLTPTREERYLYWLQGLPGVKYGRAQVLATRFKCPAELCTASVESIMELPGFGDVVSNSIWRFLHIGLEDGKIGDIII